VDGLIGGDGVEYAASETNPPLFLQSDAIATILQLQVSVPQSGFLLVNATATLKPDNNRTL